MRTCGKINGKNPRFAKRNRWTRLFNKALSKEGQPQQHTHKKSPNKGAWVTEGARTLDPQNHNLML